MRPLMLCRVYAGHLPHLRTLRYYPHRAKLKSRIGVQGLVGDEVGGRLDEELKGIITVARWPVMSAGAIKQRALSVPRVCWEIPVE
ncbi:MAG: hypothetical protein ACREWG_12115 [Gammaproteobacteria bacterium]